MKKEELAAAVAEAGSRGEPRPEGAPARGIAPLAPVFGWLCAWGVACLITFCLLEGGVGIGIGLGLLDGYEAAGLWAGLWLVLVQAVAFLVGGYAAAWKAGAQGLLHAAAVWVLAMLATGADAIAAQLRNEPGVLADLRLPFWAETGLSPSGRLALVLAILALAALVGALIGAGLAAATERRAHPRGPAEPAAPPPGDDT